MCRRREYVRSDDGFSQEVGRRAQVGTASMYLGRSKHAHSIACMHKTNAMSDPGPCAVETVEGGGGGGAGLLRWVCCLLSSASQSLFIFPTSLRSGGLEHLDTAKREEG